MVSFFFYLLTTLLISVRSFSVISVFFGFINEPITDMMSCRIFFLDFFRGARRLAQRTALGHAGTPFVRLDGKAVRR